MASPAPNPAEVAHHVRDSLPPGGLFAGHEWRVATAPFPLEAKLARELESLGRILQKFYRATDLLYRHSVTGKQPAWVYSWLDQGKPENIIELQRRERFRSALPRVIRPDILLTEGGWKITELDSVPGGIGLTDWLNQTYSANQEVIGGANGMAEGFASIFDDATLVRILVSEESETYRPEMDWLAGRLDLDCTVEDTNDAKSFRASDSIYRFFELFDLPNVTCAKELFESKAKLTAPPKTHLEEKMTFALLANDNLSDFWARELGGKYFRQLRDAMPMTWLMDPTPLPPHAAIPKLDLTDWDRLKTLSQRDRALILKRSGFHEEAWGARSVRLGSDLPQAKWAEAVQTAADDFDQSPWILQRYHKPLQVTHEWFDFDTGETVSMNGRVRLCPYYFVQSGERPDVKLGGVLATICPADKKIIHGMRDAILAPCTIAT